MSILPLVDPWRRGMLDSFTKIQTACYVIYHIDKNNIIMLKFITTGCNKY